MIVVRLGEIILSGRIAVDNVKCLYMPTLKQYLDKVLLYWPAEVSLSGAKLYDDNIHAVYPGIWKEWERIDKITDNEIENQLNWLIYQELHRRARSCVLRGEKYIARQMVVRARVLGAYNPQLKL